MAVPDDYKELDELDPIEMVSNADGAELHSRTGSAQFRAMDGNNPQAWPERQVRLNAILQFTKFDLSNGQVLETLESVAGWIPHNDDHLNSCIDNTCVRALE